MWYAPIQLPVPIPQPAPPERVPAGPDQVILSRRQVITLDGSGPVNQILERLAVAVGWRVEKTVSLPTMPTVAVWADKQPLSSIVQQINAQMQGVATVTLSPATKTIVLGAPHTMNAYPITAPDQPPAIVQQVQQPDLQGFQKTLSVEPVLAQHGQGEAGSCKGGGFTTLGAALQAILPEGWTVYTKPGVLLGVQVQYRCDQKPWTDVLREVIHKDGLVGFQGPDPLAGAGSCLDITAAETRSAWVPESADRKGRTATGNVTKSGGFGGFGGFRRLSRSWHPPDPCMTG